MLRWTDFVVKFSDVECMKLIAVKIEELEIYCNKIEFQSQQRMNHSVTANKSPKKKEYEETEM